MKIPVLIKLLDAREVSLPTEITPEIKKAFASDLMSDVLTINDQLPLLITGLSNIQTIRTAEMADIRAVVLARGKKATQEMIELANESNIALIESDYSVFRISGILYQHGIQPIY